VAEGHGHPLVHVECKKGLLKCTDRSVVWRVCTHPFECKGFHGLEPGHYWANSILSEFCSKEVIS
jgi:hypothetical protein